MTKLIAAAGLVAALVTGAADAATFTAVTTLDLSQAGFAATGFTGAQGAPAFTPISGTLAVGDTFDFTIKFKGSQTLTLVAPTLLWAFSYADVVSDVTGTGALSLLDASGSAFLTSSTKTDTEGMVHFGQQFGPGDFTVLPPVVTFSGLHYVGTVDAYVDPTVTVRTYSTPAFYFSAGTSIVSGAVPEPASWVLMVAGFGLVGGAIRSRRRAVAA